MFAIAYGISGEQLLLTLNGPIKHAAKKTRRLDDKEHGVWLQEPAHYHFFYVHTTVSGWQEPDFGVLIALKLEYIKNARYKQIYI